MANNTSRYNRNTMTDMPLNASLDTVKSTPKTVQKTPVKSKINVIGKKSTGSTDSKSSTSKNSVQTKKTKAETKETQSLEKLNEESIKNYQSKSKRNKILIVTLSILLVAVVAIIATYISIAKLTNNCMLHVHGVSATYVVNGKEMSEFRTPADMQGHCILKVDIELKIESAGEFNVKFKPECYANGQLLNNTGVYLANLKLFEECEDGFYRSISPIAGNQTIKICGGVIIDREYENVVKVDNFRMEFHTYFE